MRRCSLILPLLVACSPGPGRYPDLGPADVGVEVGVDADAEVDAGHEDTGVGLDRDGSIIVLPDSGVAPVFPFSGVFLINDQPERLFARELDGALSLIVGDHPHSYVGTIDSNGNVDVVSHVLESSGCAEARITGVYERRTAFYTLTWKSCSGTLQPFEVPLRGSLVLDPANDYDPSLSGIYDLTAQVVGNFGCYAGPDEFDVRYAVNLYPGRQRLFIMSVDASLPSHENYMGSFDPNNRSFASLLVLGVQPSLFDVSMSGQFEALGTMDPPELMATQDVWDRSASCGFTLVLSGARTSLY